MLKKYFREFYIILINCQAFFCCTLDMFIIFYAFYSEILIGWFIRISPFLRVVCESCVGGNTGKVLARQARHEHECGVASAVSSGNARTSP
jgi:hypothetical protein